MSRRTAIAALMTLAMVVASGCGSSKSSSSTSQSSSGQSSGSTTLTGSSFDSRLQSALNAGAAPNSGVPGNSGPGGGTKVTAVSCPGTIAKKKGATFTCMVTAQGGLSGTVTVTLTDGQGKTFSYKGTLQGNGETTTISGNAT